jgi:hypothetical protein
MRVLAHNDLRSSRGDAESRRRQTASASPRTSVTTTMDMEMAPKTALPRVAPATTAPSCWMITWARSGCDEHGASCRSNRRTHVLHGY